MIEHSYHDSYDAPQLQQRIGQNIKHAREQVGMTLIELAAQTNLGKSTISTIERGEGNPTIDTLWKLAGALGVSYGELISGVNVSPASGAGANEIVAELIDTQLGAKRIETYIMQFQPHAQRHADAHTSGVQEHIVVLSGALRVGRSDHVALIEVGQSHTFAADTAHVYEASEAGARILVCVMYPSVSE